MTTLCDNYDLQSYAVILTAPGWCGPDLENRGCQGLEGSCCLAQQGCASVWLGSVGDGSGRIGTGRDRSGRIGTRDGNGSGSVGTDRDSGRDG